MFWNINGFKEMIKSAEVSSWLYKNFDICFFSETHMTKEENFEVNNFKSIKHPFSDVLVKKPRGGLMCLVKFNLMQYITDVNRENPDHIVLTFHGGHKIFGSYIPPIDSLYYNDSCLTHVPNTFFNDDGSSVIIGGGDLNSRFGNIKQNIPVLGANYRPNVDKEVNAHGRFLKKICNSYNCYVLNNLNIGNLQFDGDFTFQRRERKSQNDICLSNLVGLRNITDFSIHKIGWNFSDHFPISVTVKLDLYDCSIYKAVSSDILSDPNTRSNRRPLKVISSNVDWEGYRVIASQEIAMMQEKVELLIADPNAKTLNNVVNSLGRRLYNAAKTCESKIRKPEVCLQEITPGMRNANEMLTRYSSGLCSWDEYYDSNRSAVKEISSKHYKQLINSWEETLKSDDPKSLWRKIDWKGNYTADVLDHVPDAEDLALQFKSKDASDEENLLSLDFGTNSVPVLDDEITMIELETASKRIKEGKSTSDGWVPKMISKVSDVLLPILLIIFNSILQQSIFPSQWLYCIVVALFKNKGSRLLSKYFRPVSLVQMLLKLFDFILLGRFKKWFKPHDMQTAYQNGKSSGDHIFLLRCVIQQFNLHKHKLFVTAVDFDGAFDRVKRSTLLMKLLLFGASSLFVHCLANLYSVSGNVIYSNGVSIVYMLHSGIKQGLPLSPYLFLFYIDDVFDYLDRLFVNTADIYDKIHILIHADDANLIANSKDLMVSKINAMLDYCKVNSIVLQPSKCYFTVINGSADDKLQLQIPHHDPIEYRDHLEILGSHISGSLKTDLSLHFKKRFKNVIKFFNYVRSNQIDPVSVKLKTLRACVMSALLYNCETFGPQIPEGLEQVYYKMIRAALGVRNNCPNLIVLIESGCLSPQCLIQSRQLKFFRRFKSSLQPNSTRNAVFQQLLSEPTNFLRHYVELDERYADSKMLKIQSTNEVRQKIRDLGSNKDSHYKFWIYLQLNPNLVMSPFLNRIDLTGKCITKFRAGSHMLKIETGRWNRTPREDRLCTHCNKLGDENHAIFECSLIYREDLPEFPSNLSSLWEYPRINVLFKRIREAGLMD